MNYTNQLLGSLKTTFGGTDLADMQVISKYNKEIQFLLCVIKYFSKYALLVPLKNKRSITITDSFQKV